jgi:hypothetical protein
VVDERGVLGGRDGVVALGDQVVAHVPHEQRRAPAVAAEAPGRAHDGGVDRGGQGVEHAGLPDDDRAAADVAHRPGDPVVVDVHDLEDVGLAVDRQAFEAGARLAVRVVERPPVGRARDQLGDRTGDGPPAQRRRPGGRRHQPTS